MSDKILFQCDYNEGAHPKVLERLVQTNMEQTPGYSEDKYCEEARKKIRKACGDDSLADLKHFFHEESVGVSGQGTGNERLTEFE